MRSRLDFSILPQPDDATCGPTCLHAVYNFFGDEQPLEKTISEVKMLEEGGTLAVLLACHALKRGYKATIYTFNLHVFDPTWFSLGSTRFREKLKAQAEAKGDPKLSFATNAYIEFLDLGGRLKFQDLNPSLIRHYLKQSIPILTGLSATYLYRESREKSGDQKPSDIEGNPTGHFVVLCGYDAEERKALVADPLKPNPMSADHLYGVDMYRLICAILLGIVTYDANLLVIEPKGGRRTPG